MKTLFAVLILATSAFGASKIDIESSPAPIEPKYITADYVVTAADAQRMIVVDSPDSVKITFPDDSVKIPLNSKIEFITLNMGVVENAVAIPAQLITLDNKNKAYAPGSKWEARKVAPNKWVISGNLITTVRQCFVTGTIVLKADVGIGAEPLTYQWMKGGVDIPGATTSSLTLSNVTMADAGFYSYKATNPAGSAVSVPCELQVAQLP